jgi:FeS assembly SUF system protein
LTGTDNVNLKRMITTDETDPKTKLFNILNSPTMAAIIVTKNTELMQRVIDEIKTCYDPEIPVDIWELGLIYELHLDDENNLKIVMTLTSPNCPVAESLPAEVENKLKLLQGIKTAELKLTFEPPWEKDMMSEVAQLELGFM